MSRGIETSVLVVGAGPVGLTLAMDLAWRGVDVTVVERRAAHEPPGVRCNQISARSMEIFRRLGVARALRNAGLPPNYPVQRSEFQRLGRIAYEVDVEQQCCAGLNFGYFYDRSPIIAYDGEQHPPYTMGSFASATVPGCRLPHLWLAPGRPVYDALCPDYTLMRLDPPSRSTDWFAPLLTARSPCAFWTSRSQAPAIIIAPASRPDLHVAWRGNRLPDDPLALIDLVRGAGGGRSSRHDGRMNPLAVEDDFGS